MRKLAVIGLIAVVAVTGATALASPPQGTSAARSASVRVDECSRETNSAVFHGRMRRVRGTRRMAMRFQLLERAAGTRRFRRVRAPGLGRWRRSRPGVRRFGYRQRVRGLAEGASYRARVEFRWYGRRGRRIRRAVRRSSPCRQFPPAPNLRVLRIRQVGTLQGGRAAVYAVRVLNAGNAPAGRSEVSLSVDGSAVDTVDAGALEPREAGRATFTGPTCQRSDSPVQAVADPGNAVAELDEGDNRLSARCFQVRV